MPALTTFDVTFDFTFAGITSPVDSFPAVGGDGSGGVMGVFLPFSEDPGNMATCFQPSGQAWDAIEGVPMSLPGYLLPFIVAVPLPDDVEASAYCTESPKIVDALHRLMSATTLYLIHLGSQLYSNSTTPASLPTGTYRIVVGDAVSEPFGIKCGPCSLLKVRLLNDTRLGKLLYGTFGFQQIVYVDGILEGPTYDESETKSGTNKTAGSVTKVYTLRLDNASEPVADALAMAGLHRLVEVSLLRSDGSVRRSIQAREYEAKTQVSLSDSGGFTVSMTLPVSQLEWNAAGSAGAGCSTDSDSNEVLTEVVCEA